MSIWRICEDVVRPYSPMEAAAQDARMRPVDKMLHGSERLSLRSLEFVPTGSASRLRAASQDGGETLTKPEQPSLLCTAWDFWQNIAMGRPRTHRADANVKRYRGVSEFV
jgi:beta-galactosidase GanA